MLQDSRIAGSWPDLVDRLDRSGQLRRWAVAEPTLAAADSLADLAALTGQKADPAPSDAVCGALVRIAVSDSPGHQDALLVLVHLLSRGLVQLARELADLTPCPLEMVVGELTLQVRSFGPGPRGGQRRRAFAANLLLDTRRALLRELREHCTPSRPDTVDELIDPTDAGQVAAFFDRPLPGPGGRVGDWGDVELGDVLVWAETKGVACARDLEVLLAAECSRDRSAGAAGQQRVAAALGIHHSTLRRRRDRALAALQRARGQFPAWLAA